MSTGYLPGLEREADEGNSRLLGPSTHSFKSCLSVSPVSTREHLKMMLMNDHNYLDRFHLSNRGIDTLLRNFETHKLHCIKVYAGSSSIIMNCCKHTCTYSENTMDLGENERVLTNILVPLLNLTSTACISIMLLNIHARSRVLKHRSL